MQFKVHPVVLKILRIIAKVFLTLVFLLILLILLLRLPPVQRYITGKALDYYSSKVNAPASIGGIYLDFPYHLVIKDLYLEDMQGDTLVSVGKVKVDTDLLALLRNKLRLDEVIVESLNGNVYNTSENENFNYQFIIDAFAPSDQPPVETDSSSKSMKFEIGTVRISESKGSYHDAYHGILIEANIGTLLAEARTFDLDSPLIDVSYLLLQNSYSKIQLLDGKPYEEDTTSSEPFHIDGDFAEILDTSIDLNVETAGFTLQTKVGRLQVEIDTLDINEQVYLAKEIVLGNSRVEIDLRPTDIQQADTLISDDPLRLVAGAALVNFFKNEVRFTDHSVPSSQGFNPGNLHYGNLAFRGSDLRFEDGYVKGNIGKLAATDKLEPGLSLQEASMSFKYGKTESYLKDLSLKTDRTSINGTFSIAYDTISDLASLNGRMKIDAVINKADIAISDIYYFVPSLRESIPLRSSDVISFSGSTSGTLSDLQFKGWNASTEGLSLQLAQSRIRNATDSKSLFVDIPGLHLETSEIFIRRMTGDTLLDKSLSLGTDIVADLSLQGSLADFQGKIDLNTEHGSANGSIDWKMPPDSIPLYAVNLSADSLDLGAILGREDIGALSISASADGSGIDQESLAAEVQVEVPFVSYNNYNYRDLKIDGRLEGYSFDGNMSYDDENLKFDYQGLVSVPVAGSHQEFTLNVDRIDLQALGFMQREYKLVGKVNVDIEMPTASDFSGQVNISDFFINKEGTIYSIDSVTLSASLEDSVRNIQLDSKFLEFDLESSFSLMNVGEILSSHINPYFDQQAERLYSGGESFDFTIDLKDTEFIAQVLVPDLNFLRMEPITGHFSAADSELDINLKIDTLSYVGLAVDSLGFSISSDREKLTADLKIREVKQGPIVINHTLISARSDNRKLLLGLNFRDKLRKDKYALAGSLQRVEGDLRFHIDPEGLLLNYNVWQIPENNYIEFSDAGVWFSDLRMTFRDKLLELESSVDNRADTLTFIRSSNIQLAELTRFNGDSSSLVRGLLNGEIEIARGEGLPGLTADLSVEDFYLMGDPLGKLQISSGPKNATLYGVQMLIDGKGSHVALNGEYDTAKEGSFSLNVEIDPLSLQALSVFTSDQITDVQGTLDGRLTIGGKISKPLVDGYLHFSDTRFKLTYLQNTLSLDNQRLEITKNTFTFNKFRLQDMEGHQAVIDGTVRTPDFFIYNFNLNATTTDFTLLDSRKGDNPLFYGSLKATSDIRIRGNSYLPVVNLNLKLTEDSWLTYVIPEETIAEQMQNEVVRFVDKDMKERAFLIKDKKEARDSLRSAMTGIDLNASISVSRQNRLEIVIDPITGDKLMVKGESLLNLAIKPTGDINLTGRFEVFEGNYSLNFYGLVNREFQIKEGSYILWTGDPYSAQMNVTASYTVRAAPVQVDYRGKLNFEVGLILRGEILKPEISFKLDLEEGSPAPIQVQSWVAQLNQDEAELNKQVFGLLILSGFFDDSGASNSYDNIAANTVRSSVSSLLSGELSKLSDKIEGVELTLAIDSFEDYNKQGESVGRTQLELGVSKKLFNDRVIVKVAGNIDLEGQSSYRSNVSDFSGDIRIEYLITEDGRYRLVGFRETNFDDLLQGEIIKTGAGVIFVRDYNAFRNLFKKGSED